MENVLYIYSPTVNARLKYTINVIFGHYLGLNPQLITDLALFKNLNEAKFIYDDVHIDGVPSIKPSELLVERGFTEKEIAVNKQGAVPLLFANATSGLGFDALSAIFYMLSRYEEYLPHRNDKHDRYLYTESIAWRNGFLGIPVVDYWVIALKEWLKTHFSGLTFKTDVYTFQPTIDVDHAFFIRHKDFSSTVSTLLRGVSTNGLKGIRSRWHMLSGKQPDPYDTYEYLFDLHKKHEKLPIFFILLGNYGKFDNALSQNNVYFTELIKALADQCIVGIHPSYLSNTDDKLLDAELNALRKLLHRPVTTSRQHYLKLNLPQTYQKLINRDIKHDYTMAYASQPGFRAGTSKPYPFYDLDYEQATQLMIHPTALMDGTLKTYLRLEPEESEEVITKIITEIRKVDGTFVSIWHNNTVSDYGEWHGWKKIYERMVSIAV